MFSPHLFERFWRRVEVGGTCWPWTGSTRDNGYGSLYFDGHHTTASRVAWALSNNQPMPHRSLDVCHTCDNPICVRPSHLFLGTRTDNMHDARKKGRLASQRGTSVIRRGDAHHARINPMVMARGVANGNARMNETTVPMVRARFAGGGTLSEVGREFGINYATVKQIVTRKTWKHVP